MDPTAQPDEAQGAEGPGVRRLGRALALAWGVAAVAAAGATVAGGASAAGARGWRVQPTPNPATADISYLSSVSCPSPRLCVAVGGSSHTLSSSSQTLAERWKGGRWQIQPTPTPPGTSDGLSGVSCPSARMCMAVGGAFRTASRRQTGLAEAWDGRRWRVKVTPAITGPSSLYAVSCASARSCVAVGHTLGAPHHAIVETWDGAAWHIQSLPPLAKDSELSGVSCSSARACAAVGWSNATGKTEPLAVAWNGHRWRLQTVPLPPIAPPSAGPGSVRMGMLDSVSCTSPRACTASGTDFDHPDGPTLIERWNGRTWRVQPTPNPPDWSASLAEVTLAGVSCGSATACTAIGEYNPGNRTQYFLESWHGGQWQLEPAPHPRYFAHGALLDVSCIAARCTAVGAYSGLVRLQVTLAIGN